MSAATITQRAQAFLAERRRLGFQARTTGYALLSFARFMDRHHPKAPLTIERMADWARRDKQQRRTPETWARRLKQLRPFARWLRQFESRTEVPDESVFGPVPGRVAPHIYREDEIVELLAAARQLTPRGGLRPATYETLFGLIASAGLRVSEALALRDRDVDLAAGMLTVRQTKFAKSRQLPLHPSTVDALTRYRRLRRRHCAGDPLCRRRRRLRRSHRKARLRQWPVQSAQVMWIRRIRAPNRQLQRPSLQSSRPKRLPRKRKKSRRLSQRRPRAFHFRLRLRNQRSSKPKAVRTFIQALRTCWRPSTTLS